MGLNMHTGEPLDPQMEGIFDNYSVKRQIINSGYILFFIISLAKIGLKRTVSSFHV